MARTFRTRVIAAVVVVATSATLAGVAWPAYAASGTFTQDGDITTYYSGFSMANIGPVTIPGTGTVGQASPYPSTITVTGQPGLITDLDVRLFSLDHTHPDDVDVLLVGPGGQQVTLLSDAGGAFDVAGTTLGLDDEAAGVLPDETQISGGTYRPTDYVGATPDNYPAPAPMTTGSTSLSVFDGTSPNGTWQLFVVDDDTMDSGDFSGGWRLEIQQSPSTAPYPSTLDVSGLPSGVTDLEVSLTGVTHAEPDQLDVVLVGPGGQQVTLLSDAGGSTDVSGLDLRFDDEAASALPDGGPLSTGTWRPSAYEPSDPLPSPAPAVNDNTSLSAFDATNPNGTWRLFVHDDVTGDNGVISGWSLHLTTVDPPAAPTLTSPVSGTVNSTGVVTFEGTASAGAAVRVTDGGSEVASTLASGSGAWTASLTGVATGSHSYRAVVTDTFGNSSPSPAATVMVDTASPSGSVLVNNGALRTRTPRVTLSLPATDLGSGVTEMRLSNDGVTWSGFETYAATRPWAFTAANGTKTVRVQFRDAAGNVSSVVSDSIVLDSVAPKVSTTRPGAGARGVARSKTVVAVASERLSPATVLRATAYLTKVGSSTKVRAKVTYDAATRTIRINPRRDLARRTTYVATITTAVKDAAGNFLDQQSRKGLQPKRWSFTTR